MSYYISIYLYTISLHGTKHINHEFEFAVYHLNSACHCNCNALNRTISMIFLHTYQLSYKGY